MAGEYLTFDAAGSGLNGENPGVALNIGPGTSYRLREFDAPAPSQSVLYAGSVDTEGSLPSSRKHENRLLTLKVMCDTAASLRALQAKVGKIAREGGTLKWTLPNAEVVIFDLHTADTFVPEFRVTYYRDLGRWCDVAITLPARPYGRGAQVSATLSGSPATSKAPLILTTTGIAGDVAARGSLRVNNTTTSKTWMWWGQRSRYYDSATSARLFFEAEDCQVGLSAALNAGPAGASGGGANKTIRATLIATPVAGMSIAPSGAPTHIGTYRVLARAQAPSANTGTVSVFLGWNTDGLSQRTINPAVDIATTGGTPIEGSWVVVDLGMISIPPARLGSQLWSGSLYAQSTAASGDFVHWDWIALVPVDEGCGLLMSAEIPAGSTGAIDVSDQGVLLRPATTQWGPPVSYEGDHLVVPPAGVEGRTLEMIVLLTGPTIIGGGVAEKNLAAADNIDAITATLSYTPRYLVVPEP